VSALEAANNQDSERLIYLDTWTLSVLGRVISTDSARFTQFAQVWARTGSVLALSRTHLIELRRHRDPDIRNARYDVLRGLLPARFDMLLNSEQPVLNALTDREIGVQVLRHLGRASILDGVDRHWVGFPLRIGSPDDLDVIREQLESDQLGAIFDLFYGALGVEASTRGRERGAPYERSRLGSIPSERPTDAQIEQAMSIVQEQMKALPLWQQISGTFSVEDLARGEATALEHLRGLLTRAKEVGFQQALREGDAHGQSRKNEFFDTHLQNRTFTDSVRSIVAAISGVNDTSAIDTVTRGVTRAGCPGLWLRDAVELELRRAKPQPEPNDWFDLDHLTHLPYVDLQFADREISTVTRQVLSRRNQLPLALHGVSPPVSAEASLNAVEQHLIRVANGE